MTKTVKQQAYRVISETRTDYLISNQSDIKHLPKRPKTAPYYVGDWLLYDSDRQTYSLQERKSIVSKASNHTLKNDHHHKSEQVMATNVDQVFILMALNQNFSLAKLERYYLVFYQEAVDLHFILTKPDLVSNSKEIIADIKHLYPQLSLTCLNNLESSSITRFKNLLRPQKTGLLLGSSGAGKSTLINNLLPFQSQKTNAVKRTDAKGKHTTTSSQLFYHSELDYTIIDTPGFKGIDKVNTLDLSPLFNEIISLSRQCHFPNCQHNKEPRCAIKQALASGELNHELWLRYCYHVTKLS